MTDWKKEATELADRVEDLLSRLDDEAEHGEYHASDVVPDRYRGDVPDYYTEHHRIVNEVCDLRTRVEGCIARIRGRPDGSGE